jgi:non-heme chloroperoxidase
MSTRSETPKRPRPQGARAKSKAQILKDANLPVRHGTFKSFDGTRIFYSVEGTGQPIVFCYGLVCSSLHWTYQIEHFSKNYKTIWFDYRGHQNSETPEDLSTLTVETLARDMLALADELELDKAIWLGHSMGVNTVLEFFHRNPKRVAGLVLANGTAKRPLETLFNMNAFQAAFKLLRRAYDTSPEVVTRLWRLQRGNPLVRTLISLGGFNPYLTPKEDIALYVDQFAEMDPRIMLTLIENYDHVDSTGWLHTVNVPTLLIAGELDKVIPLSQQELLHQLIPGSELKVIKHGSHCPQMDLPDLVNMHLQGFFDRVHAGNTEAISRVAPTGSRNKP